jgi:hypothetical protein
MDNSFKYSSLRCDRAGCGLPIWPNVRVASEALLLRVRLLLQQLEQCDIAVWQCYRLGTKGKVADASEETLTPISLALVGHGVQSTDR